MGSTGRVTKVGALVAALVALTVAPAAPSLAVAGADRARAQARAAGDAPVLRPGRLIYPDGHRQDIAAQGEAMQFSADGTRILGLDPANSLTIYSNDGSQRAVWTVPGGLIAATWSPDETRAAAVVGGPAGTPTRLYSVDLASGAATVLFENTPALWIDPGSGIDWAPSGARIAFTGTGHDPATGQLVPGDLNQLYTVPAAGGAAARFTPAPASSGTTTTFRNPRWSPTGSLAALVRSEVGPQYIGIVEEGSSAAPAMVYQTGGPGGSQAAADTGPFWSADGSRLAFGQLPSVPTEAKGVPTVVSAATGAVLGTYPGGNGFTDWQPCPAGTCAPWPTPRTVVVGVSKKKVRLGAKVVFFGALKSPMNDSCSDGEPVELQRAVGRKKVFRVWKRLTSAANARVNLKARVKKTARYRLVVAGSDVCMGATSEQVKVKVRKPKRR
jgi:hypothetical protein